MICRPRSAASLSANRGRRGRMLPNVLGKSLGDSSGPDCLTLCTGDAQNSTALCRYIAPKAA
eukprot:11979359-Alexandrium_andersonii.AAC.1